MLTLLRDCWLFNLNKPFKENRLLFDRLEGQHNYQESGDTLPIQQETPEHRAETAIKDGSGIEQRLANSPILPEEDKKKACEQESHLVRGIIGEDQVCKMDNEQMLPALYYIIDHPNPPETVHKREVPKFDLSHIPGIEHFSSEMKRDVERKLETKLGILTEGVSSPQTIEQSKQVLESQFVRVIDNMVRNNPTLSSVVSSAGGHEISNREYQNIFVKIDEITSGLLRLRKLFEGQGMSSDKALSTAIQRFGNGDEIKEDNGRSDPFIQIGDRIRNEGWTEANILDLYDTAITLGLGDKIRLALATKKEGVLVEAFMDIISFVGVGMTVGELARFLFGRLGQAITRRFPEFTENFQVMMSKLQERLAQAKVGNESRQGSGGTTGNRGGNLGEDMSKPAMMEGGEVGASLSASLKSNPNILDSKSPEFITRLGETLQRVEKQSPENIVRIRQEFIDEGLKEGWFASESEGIAQLNRGVVRLREQMEAGELSITFNFGLTDLRKIFESGKIRTKHELGGWFKSGKFDEESRRTRMETDMGLNGLNPKYGGLGGGTEIWGKIQFKIDLNKVKDRTTYTHYDSFLAGSAKDRPSTAQLTLDDALQSRAILNINSAKNKVYDNSLIGKAYTEAQVSGDVVIGREINEILIPKELQKGVEEVIEQYPQYKNLITYY